MALEDGDYGGLNILVYNNLSALIIYKNSQKVSLIYIKLNVTFNLYFF